MNLLKPERIGIILSITGVSLFWAYLNSVRLSINLPIELLFLAVFMCASALTISCIKTSKHKISVSSLLILFVISYGMLTLYSFRYDGFGGPDTIGEYVIASETLQSGIWPMESLDVGYGDRAGRYASCLSVTILPAVLSSVSGIDLLFVFKFILPLIGAFVPLLVYLLVDEIFKNKQVALICATLLAISHLQIFLLTYLFREQIANFFIVLTLYAALRFPKKFVIVAFASLGIIFSNAGHATADFSILLFAAFTITTLLFRIRKKDTKLSYLFSWKVLVFYVVATFSWLFFFANRLFVQHFSVLGNIIDDLATYLPGYILRVLSTGSIFPSTSLVAAGLPGSYLLQMWYYLSVVIVLFGWLFAFLRFRKDPTKASLIVYCFFMLSVFVFTLFAPGFIAELDSSRVFADLFFPIFTGLAISVPLLLERKRFSKFLKYASVITFIFLFVSLPMNLNLPDYGRILHYNSADVIRPEVRAYYFDVSFSEMAFAEWMKEYVPSDSWITVDQRGFNIPYLANHVNKTYVTSPIYSVKSDFMIINFLFIEDGIWVTPYHASYYPTRNITWQDIATQDSIVFNDGTMLMTRKVLNATTAALWHLSD